MNSLQGLVAARIAELHITKQSVADAIGCSLVTFNKKVNGESDITITEARKLAEAIEVTSDEVCRLAPLGQSGEGSASRNQIGPDDIDAHQGL